MASSIAQILRLAKTTSKSLLCSERVTEQLTAPLVEEVVLFQNICGIGTNKNMVVGLDGTETRCAVLV
jgi:hypothetical protein